ncbi:MAG: pilus assembly protein TadG-related protein [Novosphingobium sp.]
MIRTIRKTIQNLRSNTSGNALMLVGIGMPAFIGSAGLAVDTAQWYQWKRELQFAVDQASLASAYARGNNNTKESYVNRARQEFTSNLSTISNFTAEPTVTLSDYNHGNKNSVIVKASATKKLPFSGFLIGRAVTVSATSQASFTDGNLWTSCLIAIDPDDDGSITISGNTLLVARCGLAALSTSPESVVVNGTPTLDVGWVVSKGGIDDYFDDIPNTTVNEYMTDLFDPFAGLTAPTNSTPQTYSCHAASTSSTTTGTEITTTTTKVYSGNNRNSLTLQSTSTGSPGPTVNVDRPTLTADQSGAYTTTSTTTGSIIDNGNKASPRYTRTDYDYSVDRDYTITTMTTPAGAQMNPGTYNGGVKIACDTVMNPGIYVMNGGDFETHAQYTVTGSGVMIVLKNSAGLRINGGANLNLTAMTTSQLEAAGVPTTGTTNSSNLAGMLVFEDRNSPGVGLNHNMINGNAQTLLNGTVYLPVSAISFAGTASVSSQCLMIAAKNITLEGNLDMTTFCPPGINEDTNISTGVVNVKLVA